MKTLVAEIFEMHMQSPLGNFCWSGVAAASFFAEIFTIFFLTKIPRKRRISFDQWSGGWDQLEGFFFGGKATLDGAAFEFFQAQGMPKSFGKFFLSLGFVSIPSIIFVVLRNQKPCLVDLYRGLCYPPLWGIMNCPIDQPPFFFPQNMPMTSICNELV